MNKLFKNIDDKKIRGREKELELKKENGKGLGSLFGLRIALEDNISTKGIKTSVGSKMLEDYIPPFDATIVEKLLDEEAIISGKIETSEFGIGLDIDSKIAKVVKEKLADASIGIDAKGEIRNASISEGLYGLKPSYGTVSRYGLIGSGPSFEQAGIIGKDTKMLKDIFQAICGKDKKDTGSVEKVVKITPKIEKLKIGVIKEYLEDIGSPLQEQIEENFQVFKEMAYRIDYINIPSIKYGQAIYKILQSAEFSSNMGKFDGLLYGYKAKEFSGTEDFYRKNRTKGLSVKVKKKILFGNFVLSKENYEKYYEKSQRIRTLIGEEVKEVFKNYDIIINPIVQGESKYCILANIIGAPAISLPSPTKNSKYGMQIMADSFNEELLFRFSEVYEREILSRDRRGDNE